MNCTTCYIAKDIFESKLKLISKLVRVLNMNCYYETVVNTMSHLEKFNTIVAVSFSNSTCISTLPCTDRKLTEIVL